MWSFYDNLSAKDIISRNTSKPERGLSILKRTFLLILISRETACKKTSAYLMRMRSCDPLFNILLDSTKRMFFCKVANILARKLMVDYNVIGLFQISLETLSHCVWVPTITDLIS